MGTYFKDMTKSGLAGQVQTPQKRFNPPVDNDLMMAKVVLQTMCTESTADHHPAPYADRTLSQEAYRCTLVAIIIVI